MPPSAKKPKAKAAAVATTVETDPGRIAPVPVDPMVRPFANVAFPPTAAPAVSTEVVEEYGATIEEPLPGGERKVHFDETDVAFALARHTEDGKGERDPGPSDFKGFPTEGVIKEE